MNSLWRNASAAQRCLVWGAAFAVLLLLPLTLWVPPRWSFAWERAQPVPALPVAVLHFEDAPASSERVVVEPVVVARQLPRLSAPQMAVGVWIAGVLLVLGWRVLGAWQVRRLRLRSHALEDARVSEFTIELARESGVRRRIELRDSTHVSVPMTWGVFGPVLLLPRQALSWGDAPMKAALRHEIGHIRHCDALTRLVACFVCAAFWPNVLVWLAARAWRTAQEQACDDLVLRAGATRQDYAMQLFDAACGMNADAFRRAPVMAMAHRSTLETRLSAIMDDTRDRRPLRGSAWLAGGVAALALLAVCTTLQLQAEDKSVTKAAPDNKTRTVADSLPIPSGVPGAGLVKIHEKATKIILPRVEFRDATLDEVLEFIRVKSRELDPAKEGLDIVLVDRPAGDPRITLDLRDVPVSEALRYVTELAGMKFKYDETAVTVLSLERCKGEMKKSDAEINERIRLLIKTGDEAIEKFFLERKKDAMEIASKNRVSPARELAKKITFQNVEFDGGTVTGVTAFLNREMRDFDPEKRLAGIMLRPLAEGVVLPRVSLSLKQVSLDEALGSLAELAGLELTYSSTMALLERK